MFDFEPPPKRQVLALQTHALQKAIYNNPHFSYIATDLRGVIQIFNVGAERMLGYQAIDVVNKITPDSLTDPDEIATRATALNLEMGTEILRGLDSLLYKASRGIEDIAELTYVRSDGTRFPAVVSVTALRDEQRALIGYLFIGTDNSVRKQAELDLNKKHLELENARAAADKANMAKSEFLSSMSHELRTPLNAVLGFAQLMESATPLPTAAQKLSIEQILKGGWYLLHLIDEILDLALIESGKLAITQERIELSEMLHDCQFMIMPQAEALAIAVSFPDDVKHYYVDGDRIRIKQVMINLLSNAVKYNRPNGTVKVACETTSQSRMKISICDTGNGLTPTMLDQLFQPFNRLGQETSNTEGTGIGLVVTKQLVQLMGGTIGVNSEVGVGSTFWFELPLSKTSATSTGDAGEISSQLSQPMDKSNAVRRTLLYVEDNPANLNLVEQLIERRSDLKLLIATTGRDGVKMAQEELPDLIVMDINLPDISGLEALKLLQALPQTVRIPIIALSANAAPHDIEKGLSAGFLRYVTKPIKLNEFMDALDVILDKSGKFIAR